MLINALIPKKLHPWSISSCCWWYPNDIPKKCRTEAKCYKLNMWDFRRTFWDDFPSGNQKMALGNPLFFFIEMCSYVFKGNITETWVKMGANNFSRTWSFNLPPDKRNIRNRYSLCHTQIKSVYIYIYRYIYMIITKTLYLPNPIAYHDVFWPQTRAQFSIVGQCLLCTVFQKTLVSVFPFWLPPHFWEMFSLWTDYPHLSLQGGTRPVINWLFACTAMKTSSIYHLNQHQSEIGLHKQTAI
jgi:hypothetical protein